MIAVTKNAREELRKLIAEEALTKGEAVGLRLAIDRGGCAGLQYAMRFAPAADGDHIQEEDGVRVIVAGDSIDYLRGCQVDFVDSLNDSGFKIENPNAARSCGCGTSFEPADGSATPEDQEAFDAGEDCTTAPSQEVKNEK